VAATSSLRTSRRGEILLIELCDASGFPRLSRDVLGKLLEACNELSRDAVVCAAVVTGTEKCFAAGAELTEIAELDGASAIEFAALGQSVMKRIATSAKPFVAAIRGYCMGGGFDLAMACHLRIGTPDAVFAHRGAALGIITGWGGTQRLPALLGPRGRSTAIELMTTGREMRAEEALHNSLLSRIVEPVQLIDEAVVVARSAAKHALARGFRPTYTSEPHT
jgi:enoyl-CoA hydratase